MENDIKEKFEEMEKKVLDLQNRVVIKLSELEKQITNLSNGQSTNSQISSTALEEKSNSLGEKIAEKIDGIPTSHLVILSLYMKTNQSTLDIQQMIKGWGWSPDTFFEKGHFSSDMLKKGLVHDISGKDSKKSIFSLTSKGGLLAKKLIEKYQLS